VCEYREFHAQVATPAAEGEVEESIQYIQTVMGNLTVIIRINGNNDPPILVNPEESYVQPDIWYESCHTRG